MWRWRGESAGRWRGERVCGDGGVRECRGGRVLGDGGVRGLTQVCL